MTRRPDQLPRPTTVRQDGRLSIDNNLAERPLRGIAVRRPEILTVGHHQPSNVNRADQLTLTSRLSCPTV
jgi:hypothetical protein